MDSDQLHTFLKVAEFQNMTRAAEKIGLSQPALSRAIARLEEELGQPLFDRQARKVVLTDAGKVLQSRAVQLIAMLDDLKAEIRDDGQTGRLRIAAIPTIAPYFLPDLLRTFSKEFPKACVHVREDVTTSILKACKQGEIDVAILAMPVREKYLEVMELFEEELLLVMPTQHPLAKQKKITEKDIDAYPFILLQEAHCLSDNVLSYCSQRSVYPVSIERTSQLTTIQELVSLNHGISMVPEMARRIDQSPNRTYRSLTGSKPTRTIVAVWNPYRYQSRILKSFLEVLQKFAKTRKTGKSSL